MTRLFGTDGIRGEAGRFPLDPATVRIIGYSIAHQFRTGVDGHTPRIVTGRDTRESGAWIERALISGAQEAGAKCESAGVITTPGVAYLARVLRADAGIVISASHNPYQDNGIKIFGQSGRKLDDIAERLIEADVAAQVSAETPDSNLHQDEATLDTESIGGTNEDADHAAKLQARYLEYLVDDVANSLSLEKLCIVVDCANGAASRFAPSLFDRLGARVVSINANPNGRNINLDCGSLHIDALRHEVLQRQADMGVAFDGDADRALFVDRNGDFVDGDATLWVLAKHMLANSRLAGKSVVATVMSNLGLEISLRSLGINLIRTDVGDRYVLEELLKSGSSLGGEQSGHIIIPSVGLAGDGIVTTLFLLRAMRDTGESLQALADGFTRYPQVLVNVRVREKRPFAEIKTIAHAARETEDELGERGRVLLRYSGTEPLARVMIEGESQDVIERNANAIADAIKEAIGAP